MGIDSVKLRNKISGDRFNEMVFKAAGACPVYLVGGYIRDAVIGRECLDRDYIVERDHKPLAKRVSVLTGGRSFCLGNDRLHRIICNDGSTLDFSTAEGNLRNDLSGRDFTINSIAWSPETGIVDPNRGLDDLSANAIRMISVDNFKSDPVRIIRAYRFASELSFKISAETRVAIKETGQALIRAKSERITLEFYKILDAKDPAEALGQMLSDGILQLIICHDYNTLQRKLNVLSSISGVSDVLPSKYREKMALRYSRELSYVALLRLEVLLMNAAGNLLTKNRRVLKRIGLLESAEKLLSGVADIDSVLFDLFQVLAGSAPDFLIINGLPQLLAAHERYSKIMTRGLLSTGEICEVTGMREGVSLGKMINILRKAEFTNEIRTKGEAVSFLRYKFKLL